MTHPHPSREHRIRKAYEALRTEQEAHRKVLSRRPDLWGWVFPVGVSGLSCVIAVLYQLDLAILVSTVMLCGMLVHLIGLSWSFHRRCREATRRLNKAREMHNDALQRPTWARSRHVRVSRRQWSLRQAPPGGSRAWPEGREPVYQRMRGRARHGIKIGP